MTDRSNLLQFALFALLAGGVATDASAAAQRTFVASFGSDVNPCSLASPCRAFSAAMAQTLAGGEVIVLDSAGYGAVTIAQPVSIVAPPGVYAGISVISGTGITIGAGTGKVTLRGLTITGLGGTTGIQVNSADTVYIDQVNVTGFSSGLVVSAAAATTVNVQRSAFRDNGNGATFTTSAGTVAVSIEGSVFERNTTGASFASRTAGAIVGSIFSGGGAGVALNPAAGTAKVEIRESSINDNTGNGVFAGGTATATASVVSSVVSGNNGGLVANGAGNEVYASDSTITRNATGVSAVSGGTTRTAQDNRLVNNTAPGAFTATTGKL